MEEALLIFDHNPVIEGKRIVMRKITKKDAEDIYRYASDPSVSRYLLWSPHPSPDYTKRYLDEVMRQYKEHTYLDFAVVHKESGRMIGTCGFTRMDVRHHSAEIGYVLSPSFWHQGIATEAVSLILRYAFCHLGFHRVEARYMVENVYSRAVMERNGMVFEGVERGAVYAKGAYRDVGRCAILQSDFVRQFGNSLLPLYYENLRRPFFFSS